jgi:hypothetical protein
VKEECELEKKVVKGIRKDSQQTVDRSEITEEWTELVRKKSTRRVANGKDQWGR